jgi:outer membrane protein TolC
MVDPIETRLGPNDWNATLTQMIPFPGKLSKAGEIVESDARIARLMMDKTVRDMVVAIRESFFELSYIRQAAKVAGQNMELLQHLRKVAETAYAEDRTAFFDVVKAQSQEGQLRYDMLLLEELEATEIARLNGILNRSPDAAVGPLKEDPALPVAYTLDEIYRLAAENREEIRMAKVAVERAEMRVDLARFESLPEFRVGLFYAGIGQPEVLQPPPDAGKDAFGVQAGLSLPLWFGKNKGRVNRALAEKKKAKAAEAGRITQTNTEVRTVYFRLQNSRRLMELYGKELLPQAAKAMEIAETWFREGESSFSDFVETQAVWYNFNLAVARARADYGKYLARLERLVGQSLTGTASAQDIRKEAP